MRYELENQQKPKYQLFSLWTVSNPAKNLSFDSFVLGFELSYLGVSLGFKVNL
ncbi:hypothetical protein Fmac_021673 [Flemingia macrophylla]|uniref:Uncharacterized protein n=1 Tax=Flemingia macrophylla TaxID=520843 RepID=A0ABD1LXN4_9FABA